MVEAQDEYLTAGAFLAAVRALGLSYQRKLTDGHLLYQNRLGQPVTIADPNRLSEDSPEHLLGHYEEMYG